MRTQLLVITCHLDHAQVYEPGKGLAFHFDKDEHAMKEKHQMIQPVLSSVLYLTGDCTDDRLGMHHVQRRLLSCNQVTLPDSLPSHRLHATDCWLHSCSELCHCLHVSQGMLSAACLSHDPSLLLLFLL